MQKLFPVLMFVIWAFKIPVSQHKTKEPQTTEKLPGAGLIAAGTTNPAVSNGSDCKFLRSDAPVNEDCQEGTTGMSSTAGFRNWLIVL